MSRWSIRVIVTLFGLWCALGIGRAEAHVGHEKRRPKLELGKRAEKPADGPRGKAKVSVERLELTRQKDGSYVAGFELLNVGDGPLQVLRVAVDASDGPTPPAGLGVQTLPRGTPFIPAGQSRLYNVVWRSDQTLAKQVFAVVQIDTDGASPGATEFDPSLRLDLVGDARPPHTRPLLALVSLLPLGLALLALARRFFPATLPDRRLRAVGASLSAGLLVAAIVLLAAFSRGLGQSDGNDGLQHILRESIAGFPLFLALDGVSAALVPVPLLALLGALLASSSGRARALLLFGGPAASGALLLLAAQSPHTAAAGFLLVSVALGGLHLSAFADSSSGHSLGERAKALAGPALASVAFLWATHLLADASHGAHGTFGLTDLARQLAEHAHGGEGDEHMHAVLGLPFARGAALLALVAGAALGGVAPLFGTWLDLAKRGQLVEASLAGALGTTLGVYVAMRFALLISPADASFFATPLLVLGALTALGCGARALSTRDLRELAAALAGAAGGLCFVALASMTPQGLQGALGLVLARALAGMLVGLCVAALVDRLGEGSVDRAGGVARQAPLLAGALLLGLLSLSLLPGGAGFWGALLAVLGALGRAPAWALITGALLVLQILAGARLVRLLGPEPHAGWKTAPALLAHGGVVPDLRKGRERSWALLLCAALLAATLLTRFWLGMSSRPVIDVLPELDPPGATQVAAVHATDETWPC